MTDFIEKKDRLRINIPTNDKDISVKTQPKQWLSQRSLSQFPVNITVVLKNVK